MKKIYLVVAFAILGVLGFKGYAQDEAPKATVTIDGQFYTFVAQAGDDNRDEAFAFSNANYDNEIQEFTFTPDVVYTLKGQNESNSFFVYVNGVQLNNTVGADQTGYEATVTFADGDVVEIYENTPYVASVNVAGQFYTLVAQNPDNTRDEAFAFTNNTYDNETSEFNFCPGVTYTIKAQNEANVFMVLVNGTPLANALEADQTGYEASVKFVAGDVVEVYSTAITVSISGQFYTFAAQAGENNRDEAFAFTNDTYNNETGVHAFNPNATYTVKGQNEANSFFVYVNGVQLNNTVGEDQTGYEATVKFVNGDVVEIYENTPYVASVKINGQFYTFVAQNADNTRDEAFAFSNETYNNETVAFNFNPGVTYTLKGQNEANTFAVFVNGVELKNETAEGETGYVANVKFNIDDVVEIYEESPYTATVTIDGQFYTFVAQNADNTRDEAFAFTNDTYDNVTSEFNFNPNVTYTLKGQNEANTFAVFVNDVQLPNEVGEGETGYVANIKFNVGDVVKIYEVNPYTATVTINGQFYTFVAQNPDNTRDEAFAFTNDTYDNATSEFNFNPNVTYTLKGQNEANTFAVYVNGVELVNETGEGETGYVANVKFNIGDVVEIYDASPYTGTVKINGQFYTFVAQNADNTRDEAFAFTNATYENETTEFTFNPGVIYTLKGQNEANTFAVYVNGVELVNETGEGETGYVANVKFNIGDVVEIYETSPYVASVTIDGQFYTFVAQNPDNTRDEAFDFTNATYENETAEFTFNPGVTYTLKGQNEANTFAVYVNGVELKNEAAEGETGYVANVKFNIGDVVEIFENSPYTATVKINGQFYTFVAQNPDNTRDEAFAFTNATYDNETVEFTFNPAVTYILKGQNEANSFAVFVNGVELKNTVDADQTGYEAAVKFAAGDVVEIYEASPYVATVTIDGQFYTFVAQNADNTRDEAFDFTNATYENETAEFTFNPEVTYTLKGQNEANTFAVFVNGVELVNETGEGETGYVANVKFNIGDVVEIYNASPYTASVTIDGQFYTFVAQNADNTRDEAFVFTNDTYDNETVEFTFNPGVTYTLKGQNESNEFAVFVNGVELKNEAGEGETGYVANVKFNIGDVVEIMETTPYTATVVIDGQFYTFVAQNPDNTRDEAFAFTNATYDNEESEFTFNPEVTYTLKGQNESNTFAVYVNGVELVNETGEGETGYVANVKFNIGDVVEIYETSPYVATVTIDGQFYTFVAQNADNTRDEAFDFTNATYENETAEFTFNPGVTYTLKGQNESNTFAVYVNGVELKNEVGEGETGYVANVKFEIGDVVEIYETSPYVASVTIDGQFYTFVAQNPDNTRDEAFDFTNNTYDNETREFTFNPEVTYTLKGQNESNTFYVLVNGVELANEAEEGETGYVANIKFEIGDIVEIYDNNPTSGIDSIYGDSILDGKVYNLQGIEMKKDVLTPGIYIVNGKKMHIR